MKTASLRAIPSVEKLLQALGETGLPRPAVLAVVRRELGALRARKTVPGFDSVLADLRTKLAAFRHSRLQPVINGTGIVIHTNLGRAPLGPAVQETLSALASNYSNLEIDLNDGERGGRAAYLEHNLALLCGAEAATVVNNCAAALVLVLRHFAVPPKSEVIVSRGELVQIGGGFRVPEILEASGARLREVGTTNRTSVADYARVIGRETALILKVHRSNFFMGGFVESAGTEELGALARRKRVPFVEDLGSGAMTATESLAAIEHEPTPAEVLRRGVDVVCCSGDKLLGGPQAGIVAGKTRIIAALKREPFFRALRCDKLILGALQTTVDLYLEAKARESVPALAMLAVSNDVLRERARKLIALLDGTPLKLRIGDGEARLGGGALPRSTIPSVTLDMCLEGTTPAAFAARLRLGTPPVIGCVSAGAFRMDLRTIFPRQDDELAGALRRACTERSG